MTRNFIRDLILSVINAQLDKLYKAREELDRVIHDLEDLKKKYSGSNPEAVSIRFYQILDNGNLKEITMAIQKVTETKTFTFKAVDAFGNEAAIESPVWALSEPALGSLVVSADGKTAALTPAGMVGEMKLQLAVDGKVGEGEFVINGELPITLIPGDAVAVEIKEVI